MKHFFAVESASESTAKRYTYTFEIYQIKNNTPQYIGRGSIMYGPTRGAESEVMSEIARLGYIPKKFESGYYHNNAYKKSKTGEDIKLFDIKYIVPKNQK